MSLWERIKRWFAAWRFKRHAKGMGFGPQFKDVCYIGWNRNKKKRGYMTLYGETMGFYDFTAADVRKVELLQFADSWVKYKIVFTSGRVFFATLSLKCMFFFEWYFKDKIYRDADDVSAEGLNADNKEPFPMEPLPIEIEKTEEKKKEKKEKKELSPEEKAARKKKIKKVILITAFSLVFVSIIVLVALYFTAVFGFAFTKDGIYDVYYDTNDDGVKGIVITGYSRTSGDVVIPEKLLGKPVIGIGGVSFKYSQISSVTIPGSVTSIGEHAFYGCSGLTSVTIGNSVTSLGEGAFYGCSGLTSITIPDSVTSTGYSVFSGCSGLTSVTIGNSVTSIGNGAFYGCSGLTSITISDRVTSIGMGAFSGCTGLTSITIPDSVTLIESSAFSNCTCLTEIIYQGFKAKWNAIIKSYWWNNSTGNYTIKSL